MRFSFGDQSNKDFRACLGAWVVMEIVGFGIMPLIKVVPSENVGRWFLLSLPLGLGGAFLVGLTSDFVNRSQSDDFVGSRRAWSWIGQIGSWFGLAGVGFPMIIAITYLLRSFGNLKT